MKSIRYSKYFTVQSEINGIVDCQPIGSMENAIIKANNIINRLADIMPCKIAKAETINISKTGKPIWSTNVLLVKLNKTQIAELNPPTELHDYNKIFDNIP